MPWGKHRGVRLRLIPTEYLSWLTTLPMMRTPKWKWLWDSLISELKFRGYEYKLAETVEPTIEMPDPPPKKARPIRKIRVGETQV